jgi:hypothetical protein
MNTPIDGDARRRQILQYTAAIATDLLAGRLPPPHVEIAAPFRRTSRMDAVDCPVFG